jgi:hypothetical protein
LDIGLTFPSTTKHQGGVRPYKFFQNVKALGSVICLVITNCGLLLLLLFLITFNKENESIFRKPTNMPTEVRNISTPQHAVYAPRFVLAMAMDDTTQSKACQLATRLILSLKTLPRPKLCFSIGLLATLFLPPVIRAQPLDSGQVSRLSHG